MTENTIELLTLAQLSQGQDWRVQLCHDRPVHMLIWITRGQGLLQLDGQRRGLGAHNAVFIPARALFALDMGRQGIGQAVVIPDGTELRLPQMPRHLRIRDVQAQTELTGLIEAAQLCKIYSDVSFDADAITNALDDAPEGVQARQYAKLYQAAAKSDVAAVRAEILAALYESAIINGDFVQVSRLTSDLLTDIPVNSDFSWFAIDALKSKMAEGGHTVEDAQASED